jgi:hypothetical protein
MAIFQQQALGALHASDPEAAAFSQLFGTLAANPAVERIAIHAHGDFIDLWARLDDEAREMAIYDALDAYHASQGVTTAVEVHLILPRETDFDPAC